MKIKHQLPGHRLASIAFSRMTGGAGFRDADFLGNEIDASEGAMNTMRAGMDADKMRDAIPAPAVRVRAA